MEKNLKTIYKIIMDLTKNSLFPESINIDTIDNYTIDQWKEILKHASIHGLYSFVAQSIIELSGRRAMDKGLKINSSLMLEKREKRYDKIADIVKEIGEKLKAENVNMLILKGLSISQMYDKPYMRDFGDLDCYLMGKYEVLNDILEKEGIIVKNKKHKHSNCIYKGLSIENHRNLLNIDIYDNDKKIQPLLIELAKEAEKNPKVIFKNNNKYNNILSPSPMFNAIYLLRHSISHFIVSNMPLRHLTDWAMFLKYAYGDIDCEKLRDLYKKFDMERIAGAFCYLCVEYLGMDEKYSIYPNYQDYKEFAEIIYKTTIESNLMFQQKSPGGLKHIKFKWDRLMRQSKPYKIIYGGNFWRKKVTKTLLSYVKAPEKMLNK